MLFFLKLQWLKALTGSCLCNSSLEFIILVGAEPIGHQWMQISPSVLSVQVLEFCTHFRNWISLYSTWRGERYNHSLSTCTAAGLWRTSPALQTNDLKLIQQRAFIFLLPTQSQSFTVSTLTWVLLEVGRYSPFQNCVHCSCILSLLVWGELQAPGVGVMYSGNREVEVKNVWVSQPCLTSLSGKERWYWCNTCH